MMSKYQDSNNIFSFEKDFMVYLHKEFKLNVKDLVILEYLARVNDLGVEDQILFDADELTELLPILHLNKQSAIRRIKKIADKTAAFYMSNFNDQEAKKILCSINRGVASDNGIKTCEWCKIKTFLLEKHHFPIRKKDGGDDIINICPNCHRSFHYLTDYKNFIIKVKDKNFFTQVRNNVRYR
jgi:hypothetical protein